MVPFYQGAGGGESEIRKISLKNDWLSTTCSKIFSDKHRYSNIHLDCF
jgi:hypothetical protein